jgi:L-ascorbate metabolism protein UlaG (beta-lactamase superfamily)
MQERLVMIEPLRSGPDLVAEIEATRPVGGTLAVWWLGQSGFLLKSAEATVVIDPYLSEHLTRKYEGTARPHVRMTRAPLRGRDLSGVDAVLCSHKHSDHLDPGTLPDLLAASPAARLVVPEALVNYAAGLGLPRERIEGLDAGASWNRSGLTVRAVASAHEGLDTDEAGRHLYLGFVVEMGGLRVYHSGDGLAYEGLADRLAGAYGSIDVAFLPVNGRDPARGVPGNMSAAEAVDLANAVRPRFVVPHHYDMFTFNTVPASLFEAEARRLSPGVAPRVLRCGERWEVRR